MRPAPEAWLHLTDEVGRRYMAFLLSTLPKLAAAALPRIATIRSRRYSVLRAALRHAASLEGLGLEFGVHKGRTLRLAGRTQPNRHFIGFDSFTGFPEDCRPDWQIDFAVGTLPRVPSNCTLVPGWFDQTLPAALAARPEPVAFVNIDCDLYSSTRTVLFGLRDQLLPGTVLYFDELVNYDTALWNEMLALFEFLEATGLGIHWVALQRKVRSVETTLEMLDDRRFPSWKADVSAGYGRSAAGVLTAENSDLMLLERTDQARHIDALAKIFGSLTGRLRTGWLVDRNCDSDSPSMTSARRSLASLRRQKLGTSVLSRHVK